SITRRSQLQLTLSLRSFLPGHARLRHRLHRQDLIESRRFNETALENDLPNRYAGKHRCFGNLRGLRVTEIWTERGGDRCAPIEQLATPRGIGLNAFDAEHFERAH